MPDWKKEIRRRLQDAALPAAREASVVDELADHLGDYYDELTSRGVSEAEATERTLAELRNHQTIASALGGPRRGEETARIEPGAPPTRQTLADAWRDVRYAVRLLRRTPAFTAITVLTLAFGIGANTTVFTIISTLFLNPFPVANQSELVVLHARQTTPRPGQEESLELSHLNLNDLRARTRAFSRLAGHTSPMGFTYLKGQVPERLFGALVTGDYFDVLGLRPAAGRFFTPEEDRTPGTSPLVLGYAAWQRRFAADPAIVGRTLQLNGIAFTVIGVAPAGFKGIEPIFGPDLWIPSMMAPVVLPAQMRDWLTNRAAPAFRGVARLAPGVSAQQAEASVRVVAAALAQEYPEANRGRTLSVEPLTRAALMGSGGQSTWTMIVALWAVPVFVLLIACSNVANLLLARAAARRQEMAVRLALGAGRARLLRQLVTESLVLALTSGMLGAAFAIAGSRLLWSFRPVEFAQNLVDLSIDGRVLVFAAIVSLVTGLVFGLAPALQASRPDIVTAVKEETRTAGRTRRGPAVSQVLLVGQVALSLLSLVMAGLCIRSIQRAYAIDPGFDTERLGIVLLSPGQAGYDRARTEQFYREAETRLASLPGVRRVSWATNLPLFARPPRTFAVDGVQEPDEAQRPTAIVNTVGLGYFDTTRIALTRGRDFAQADRADTPPVAIVNQALATAHWPGRDPIGRRIRLNGEDRLREVVGVVKTVNYQALGEPPQPCVYLPLQQNFADTVVLYVATAGDPAPIMTTVQRELRALDGQVDAGDVRTARTIVGHALFGATAGVGLLTTFGLVALALASLGLYGLMAYAVNLRQREIAVRMAIGASRGTVLQLVLRQGLTLVAVGVAIGITLSFIAGRAVSGLLYGVSAADPISLAASSLVLFLVAFVACLVPAYRASRLDPLQALRT
jgi:predicted permease